VLKLKPNEFWRMNLTELMDMIDAHVWAENRDSDLENQRVAWQTAHIMNATGKYKKRITPTDLYNPDDMDENAEQKVVKKFESTEQKEDYLQELKKKFGKE
jgi:hypothetical protein